MHPQVPQNTPPLHQPGLLRAFPPRDGDTTSSLLLENYSIRERKATNLLITVSKIAFAHQNSQSPESSWGKTQGIVLGQDMSQSGSHPLGSVPSLVAGEWQKWDRARLQVGCWDLSLKRFFSSRPRKEGHGGRRPWNQGKANVVNWCTGLWVIRRKSATREMYYFTIS